MCEFQSHFVSLNALHNIGIIIFVRRMSWIKVTWICKIFIQNYVLCNISIKNTDFEKVTTMTILLINSVLMKAVSCHCHLSGNHSFITGCVHTDSRHVLCKRKVPFSATRSVVFIVLVYEHKVWSYVRKSSVNTVISW